ncbi:hypothetical protein NKR23_g2488 [Pleurostoma richardsiae]|uniref:Uncharacterized protein n=1 Tax=Pleurostoma richardsiae TaxID=41990 RepID=A0AA38RQJ5_9PEZI|nr:hypothetical protein NKR23_g2488 [Pleurostoma richardsiae]
MWKQPLDCHPHVFEPDGNGTVSIRIHSKRVVEKGPVQMLRGDAIGRMRGSPAESVVACGSTVLRGHRQMAPSMPRLRIDGRVMAARPCHLIVTYLLRVPERMGRLGDVS